MREADIILIVGEHVSSHGQFAVSLKGRMISINAVVNDADCHASSGEVCLPDTSDVNVHSTFNTIHLLPTIVMTSFVMYACTMKHTNVTKLVLQFFLFLIPHHYGTHYKKSTITLQCNDNAYSVSALTKCH